MSELVIPESIAASGVATAAMRANEGRRPDALFDDPLARLLVTLADQVPAERRGYLADGKDQTSPLTQMMGEYLPVRTHFFDTHLRATADAGARQIVLLGSGLDARAFRMPWPKGTRIYEIDTPDVHAFKEELIAKTDLEPAAERITISSDATGEWRALIAAAGFDYSEPTSWLAEGLLFYLDRKTCDDLASDLASDLAASPAPVTWFAGDYVTSTLEDRAAFSDRHRTDEKDTRGEADMIDRGLLPHNAPGPGVSPAHWLSADQWTVTESTFAAHGALIDRFVPDHWDPELGGETMWMFHAVSSART